jgi:ABC-type multidrug transport system fused ATPase/permease subunit
MQTLLELVNGLLVPDEGEVELDGRRLDRVDLPLLRGLSAPAGQGALFAMSIAENIAYGRPDASRADVEKAARLAHAQEVALRLSDGYDTQVGEEGGQLSGGERQRIGWRGRCSSTIRSFCSTTSPAPSIRRPPTRCWTGSRGGRRAPLG